MQPKTTTGTMLSYSCGIIIAAIVVGCLIFTFYVTSETYAMQQLETKSVPELVEVVEALKTGPRPHRGAKQDRIIAATLALGKGDDALTQRINAIAIAGGVNDSPFESAAQIAIKEIGPASHDYLKQLLDSDQDSDIEKAIVCIRLLGQDAAVFVDRLIEMIDSGDPTKIRHGVFAMQAMGIDAAPAIDSLNDVLLGLDFNAQIMVCKAVVGVGRDAAPMADNLAKIFAQGIPSARSWAGIALGAIGPIENFDTAEMLGSRITAFTHIEKIRALQGLALMGDEAVSQIDAIQSAMDKPDGRVRPQAAFAYYKVTNTTQKPVGTLIAMLSNRDYADAALEHLRKMGPDAKAAIEAVRELLNHSEVGVREQAVLVLGNMGSAAAGEIEAINRLGSDPDPLLRQAVEESVAAIQKAVANDASAQ